MRLSLFLGLLLLALTTCTDQPAEPKQATLVIEVSSDFPIQESQIDYVFINDSLGNFLDLEKVVPNTKIELKAPESIKRVSLTYAQLSKTSTQESHFLSTFLRIPMNGDPLKLSVPAFPPTIGSVKVTISNYPGTGNPMVLSVGNDALGTFNTTVSNSSFSNGTYSADLGIIQPNSELVINATRNYEQVYKVVSGLNANDVLNLNFDDFTPYTDKLELNTTPTMAATVVGFKGENTLRGYTLCMIYAGALTTSLGYLPGYDNYMTNVVTTQTKSSIKYSRLGTKPTVITMPDLAVNVTDNQLSSFSYEASAPPTFRIARWFFSDSAPNYFNWLVYGEGNNQKVQIPEELSSKYSYLKADLPKYASSTYIRCISGCSYMGRVREFFTKKRENLEYHEYAFVP